MIIGFFSDSVGWRLSLKAQVRRSLLKLVFCLKNVDWPPKDAVVEALTEVEESLLTGRHFELELCPVNNKPEEMVALCLKTFL